jgi:hypothetical protein
MRRVVMRGLDPPIHPVPTIHAKQINPRVTAVDRRAPQHQSRFRELVRKPTSNHGENPVTIAMRVYIRRSR